MRTEEESGRGARIGQRRDSQSINGASGRL